jgi:hypothetical protein
MAQRNLPAYMLAICYADLGKNDEALVWLENACEEHSAESPFVNVDPRLAA